MPFKAIQSPKIFKSPAPFSPAALTTSARLLHISGQVPQDREGKTVGAGDIEKQTVQVLENMKALVTEQGGGMKDVCKITVFLTSRDHLPKVMEVRRRYFEAGSYPATSAVIVAGLANAEWMVEIEATAALP